MRAVTNDEFSMVDAVGGVRGLVESVLPGFVFIVVFLWTGALTYALAAAVFLALVAVGTRLATGTPIAQALGGLFGIAIGVLWAWRSGEAQDFFAFGLWQNAAYLLAVLVSILVGWPPVGVVVELMRAVAGQDSDDEDNRLSLSKSPGPSSRTTSEFAEQSAVSDDAEKDTVGAFKDAMKWRSNPVDRQRYVLASWLWVALFAIRLAVQVPLFFNRSIGWLGTARLVLGVPLWALVLYLTWAILRRGRVAADGA